MGVLFYTLFLCFICFFKKNGIYLWYKLKTKKKMEAKVIVTSRNQGNVSKGSVMVKGNTDTEVCYELYKIIRMYRYCNDTNADFADEEWQKKMETWYANGHPTMDEYYGGGIVD